MDPERSDRGLFGNRLDRLQRAGGKRRYPWAVQNARTRQSLSPSYLEGVDEFVRTVLDKFGVRVAQQRRIMTTISETEFSKSDGVADWRALYWGAKAYFRTGDFATGAKFVAAIAEHAAALKHDPLVDLRDDNVAVQVVTPGVGISDTDLELARRISVSAAELGIEADPSAVQQLELAIDAEDPDTVVSFWRAALGYVHVAQTTLVEPNLVGPSLSVTQKPYVAPRNRIHVDISVPHDQAQARVDAILAAGGRMLGDPEAPAYWSLIDTGGNVVDIATWQGRGEPQ